MAWRELNLLEAWLCWWCESLEEANGPCKCMLLINSAVRAQRSRKPYRWSWNANFVCNLHQVKFCIYYTCRHLHFWHHYLKSKVRLAQALDGLEQFPRTNIPLLAITVSRGLLLQMTWRYYLEVHPPTGPRSSHPTSPAPFLPVMPSDKPLGGLPVLPTDEPSSEVLPTGSGLHCQFWL